ncbi:MAG: hypothetical protein E7420_02870 [Ruminococcaceae bacterium]|nr:hypothetical protein [Oscillospiraceae bacterium]
MAPNFYKFQYDFEQIFQDEEFLRIFLIAFIAVFAVVLLIFVLPNYIMLSISYTSIGRRRGIKASWLAWIPIARYWVIGAIADNYDERQLGVKRRFRILLLILALVCWLSVAILFAGLAAVVPLVISAIDGSGIDVFSNIMKFAFALEYGASGFTYAYMLLCVLYLICIYKIFESLSPKYSILFMALSMIIPLFMPICLLVIRKNGYSKDDDKEELSEAAKSGWYEA